jgi:hypothetical protein
MNNVGLLEHHSSHHCDEPADWGIIWIPFLLIEGWEILWHGLWHFPLLFVCSHISNKDRTGNFFPIVWGSNLGKKQDNMVTFYSKVIFRFHIKETSELAVISSDRTDEVSIWETHWNEGCWGHFALGFVWD